MTLTVLKVTFGVPFQSYFQSQVTRCVYLCHFWTHLAFGPFGISQLNCLLLSELALEVILIF